MRLDDFNISFRSKSDFRAHLVQTPHSAKDETDSEDEMTSPVSRLGFNPRSCLQTDALSLYHAVSLAQNFSRPRLVYLPWPFFRIWAGPYRLLGAKTNSPWLRQRFIEESWDERKQPKPGKKGTCNGIIPVLLALSKTTPYQPAHTGRASLLLAGLSAFQGLVPTPTLECHLQTCEISPTHKVLLTFI